MILKEGEPAVPCGVPRLEVADRSAAGADIGTPADHSQEHGALFPLLRLRYGAEAHIFLISVRIIADKIARRIQSLPVEKLRGLRTDSL